MGGLQKTLKREYKKSWKGEENTKKLGRGGKEVKNEKEKIQKKKRRKIAQKQRRKVKWLEKLSKSNYLPKMHHNA